MANAATGKKTRAVSKSEEPVSDPAQAFERFKAAMRRLVTVPKAEIDRRAKVWVKAHKKKRRKAST